MQFYITIKLSSLSQGPADKHSPDPKYTFCKSRGLICSQRSLKMSPVHDDTAVAFHRFLLVKTSNITGLQVLYDRI